jgi:capsular exopolysaccharide synthesis family protein
MASPFRESAEAPSLSQALTLKRYLRTLREHVILIVVCVVVAGAAAVAYVKTAPKKYSAQSEMLVSPLPADTTLIGLPVLITSGDPTQDVLTGASLVTTTPVATAVLNALQLRESPQDLLASVQAAPVGQTDLISIQADASSAAQAQRIANEFATQVVATRATALHTAIADELPGLKAQAAALPPAERNGPGTVGGQIDQLDQLRTSNDPTITIAATAALPSGPYSPRTKLTVLAALFGGLIVGLGAAFLVDALDPRLQRADQMRKLMPVPILARIPRERRETRGKPILPEQLSFAAAEGYRTMRTMLTSHATEHSRSFLVTSSSPEEGKTTTAINLASALAQGGSSTILIDADLRRPTVASAFGLTVQYGTEHVLSGEVKLADALLTPWSDSTLRVLAVHNPGVDRADKLTLAVAHNLIEQATALADFVVIDAPPLTTVIDALPLARLADDVLVVARLSVSKLSKISELEDLLYEQDQYPTGVVLIGDSPRRRNAYDYAPEESGQTSFRRPRSARGPRERPPASEPVPTGSD